MTDLQGNTLEEGDIVYCCSQGRSKRLVRCVVSFIDVKIAKLMSLDDSQSFSRTSLTIIKAFSQDV